jgi:hypothetical protein
VLRIVEPDPPTHKHWQIHPDNPCWRAKQQQLAYFQALDAVQQYRDQEWARAKSAAKGFRY